MRRQLFFLLVFLSLIILAVHFGLKPISEYLGFKVRSGLQVESNREAKVAIDGKEVGQTPYKNENLTEGEVTVSLTPVESSISATFSSWEKLVKLHAGTLTVVNRELDQDPKKSSGEVITLEKGQGVTVVTNPSSATVLVDGDIKGQTPLTISEISPGEKHFLISKDDYLKRSIRATIKEGYMLTLSVDLAAAGGEVPKATPLPIVKVQQVVVVGTPNGFLRVRSDPSTLAKEVARVKEGDVLDLEEEQTGWDKIKLSDGTVGYVSASYVKKKEP